MILFYKSVHIVAVIFLWANVAYSLARVRAGRQAGARELRAVFAEISRQDPWLVGGAWVVIVGTGWLLMGVLEVAATDESWLTWSLVLTGTGIGLWWGWVLRVSGRLAGGDLEGTAAATVGHWYAGTVITLVVIPAVVFLLMVVKPDL